MQAVEGIYQNGHIKLLETPKAIRRARVVVTFLDDAVPPPNDHQSLVGTVEILDDDLETASLEIRAEFLAAIEKSGAELVISGLQKAIRKGLILAGAIIHSDCGSQYASNDFRALLQGHDFRQSISGKGNCYDIAQRDQFLFQIQSQTDWRRSVCRCGRSPVGDFQLHRWLLQSGQITFKFGLSKSNRI